MSSHNSGPRRRPASPAELVASGDRRDPRHPFLTTLLLSALVTALLAASVIGIAVLLRRNASPPTPADTSGVVRDRAAAWVVRNIGRDARIACEPVMCDALLDRGASSAHLRATASDGDMPGADVMVLTPALRSYRPRLDPMRLAAFGSGNAAVEVYAVAGRLRSDDGPAIRTKRGTRLLLSGRTRIAPPARAPLGAGRVDSRLLSALNHASGSFVLGIGAIGPATPGADPRLPLRSADITTVNGVRVTPAAAPVRRLLGGLRAGPYAAGLDLSFRPDGAGNTSLHVIARVPVAATPAGAG